jgi:hypothetical protein
MLEDVRKHAQAGDRGRAREALAAAIKKLFVAPLLQGDATPPYDSPEGAAFITALRAVAPALLDDPSRASYVTTLLDDVRARINRGDDGRAMVFLAQHALLLALPTAGETISDALQEAKYELVARATPDGLGERLVKPKVVIRANDREAGRQNELLEKIQRLTPADLEAPEGSIPNIPPIQALEGDILIFACPACRKEHRTPIATAGSPSSCGCGASLRVPIPAPSRVAAARKASKEAAAGIVSCRICAAKVNTRRDANARAGFCSLLCAKQGRQKFGEFVAKTGTREGDSVSFACECGAALQALAVRAGSRVTCGSCSVQVWIPEPGGAAAPAAQGVTPCPKCGRNVKAGARRCMFCGQSMA